VRHSDDPDIVRDSKAVAAFCLAVLGLVTAVLVAGVVPATVALVLARQASLELEAGRGWRTGARHVIWARRLARAALAVAVLALALVVAVRLLQDAGLTDRDYPPNVN
jgi:hydroxylaminobenzene mutase